MRTLAELNCKVLLEIGPQPVLTATALRAWPDPATAPRAIASLRRNTADHRQITEAVADAYVAGHLPDFAAFAAGARAQARPTHLSVRASPVLVPGQPGTAPTSNSTAARPRTDTVRLLEDGHIDELATLLDGATGDDQTMRRADQACGTTQSATRRASPSSDDRYEIRWEKSAAPTSGARRRRGVHLAPHRRRLRRDPAVGRRADRARPSAPDRRVARLRRRRGAASPTSCVPRRKTIRRCASCTSPPSTRTGSATRRRGRCCGCNTESSAEHGGSSVPRSPPNCAAPIWVVTRGAQRVTDADTVAPDQSCLWGFGRAAALELPQVWGGLADLADRAPADEWSAVHRPGHDVAASRPSGKTRSRCASNAVYVPRLVRRAEQPSATPLELRSDATYLVTGGLGSIGLEIAGYLAANGAEHLVLTSRRAPSDAAQQRIDALGEQHGCEFRVVTADVADAHDVARLLAGVQAELPPLAGIVHAAGEIGTTPLSDLDDAEVDRVFAGKVWGAWHLSEAAADLQLDFFVSTSSIASVWGGYGQTAYGAANAFLDGLAWRLREQGVPGTSVNFGPWSAGMADAESRARLDQRGVRTLSPADALAGLADAMTSARRRRASWPASTGPASCRCTSRRAGGHSWRSWSARSPARQRRRAVRDAVGKDPARRAAHQRSRAAAQEAPDRLPARRGRGGDPRRRRRDPRGRRVLRPRHGFADGRRTAAPHRTGRWPRRFPSRW